MLFVPVTGLWTSAIGIVGLALNLRAYDLYHKSYVQQKILNLKHSIQKYFIKRRYSCLMAAQDQPHENFVFPEGITTWKRPLIVV
jgi:photosystem II P680 reaction center D2 protein